ncbi:MAG TPA: hypothetical protein VEL47_05860 [Myxococcota bacterium]|nr:hypothetical protein [Myxococcota bacterium]
MSQGLERLFSPGIFDIVFPFFAFFLVIILPSIFAINVIIKVLRGQYTGEDRH